MKSMALHRQVCLVVQKIGDSSARDVLPHLEEEEDIIVVKNALYEAMKKGFLEVASIRKNNGKRERLYRFVKMDEVESITKIAILNRKELELAWAKMKAKS